MKIFDFWKNPKTINQFIAKGLIGGSLITIPLVVVVILVMDALFVPTPSDLCRKDNVFGSSAWVACVDRVVLERK